MGLEGEDALRKLGLTTEVVLPPQFFSGAAKLIAGGNIFRVGADMCDVPRMAEAINKHPYYIPLTFTEEEITYCESAAPNLRAQRYAARFAGKESVAKAIGGLPHRLLDISILKERDGSVRPELRGRAREYVESVGIDERVCLSLSHLPDKVLAFAMAVYKSPSY